MAEKASKLKIESESKESQEIQKEESQSEPEIIPQQVNYQVYRPKRYRTIYTSFKAGKYDDI